MALAAHSARPKRPQAAAALLRTVLVGRCCYRPVGSILHELAFRYDVKASRSANTHTTSRANTAPSIYYYIFSGLVSPLLLLLALVLSLSAECVREHIGARKSGRPQGGTRTGAPPSDSILLPDRAHRDGFQRGRALVPIWRLR
jgi:hypothetical protein